MADKQDPYSHKVRADPVANLVLLWGEYKQTECYGAVRQSVNMSDLGMGLGGLFGDKADIFTDFMEWLTEVSDLPTEDSDTNTRQAEAQ